MQDNIKQITSKHDEATEKADRLLKAMHRPREQSSINHSSNYLTSVTGLSETIQLQYNNSNTVYEVSCY